MDEEREATWFDLCLQSMSLDYENYKGTRQRARREELRLHVPGVSSLCPYMVGVTERDGTAGDRFGGGLIGFANILDVLGLWKCRFKHKRASVAF